MKRVMMGALAAVFAVVMVAPAFAADEATPGKSDTLKWAESEFHYVGSKKCKMCHKQQFNSWKETKHASAWESLKPKEQENAECAACHSIGLNKTDSLLTGVGCESCHGPGEKYKSKKKMNDVKLASAAGLLPVTEATCVRCHNKKSPNFKEFKYEAALKAGVHEHFEPKKKKK